MVRPRWSLVGILILVASGCQVRYTEELLPEAESAAPAVERAVVVPPTVVRPWRLVGGPGVAIPVAEGRAWSPTPPPHPTITIAGPSGPITAEVAPAPAGAWLSWHGYAAPVSAMRQSPVAAGEQLYRRDWNGRTWIEEPLVVLGSDGEVIWTSCPRRPRGILFDADGRWLPWHWALASDGGCPVLVRLVLTPAGEE